jgi:DMSO reductase family type II enzyme molybdopterin subunit
VTISRRGVLGGMLGAGVALPALAQKTPEPERPDPREGYPGKKTEDLYRAEFEAAYGDGEEHGYAYHCVNCQGNCAFDLWVKDGKITRENQSALYPQIAPDIPDANPRGCNKGAQHSQVLYEADRLLYPMKRTGARGEGKWKRITWDEAITEVASQLYRTMVEKGPAGNYVHIGSGVLTEARAASIKRLGALLGAVRPYIASAVGDMFPGVTVVYGEGNIGCTYDFIYTAGVNVFWGCNPNTSRIPDAHYLWEGKYNGSKIVVIAPEFNSTAIHADLWVPIKPGYDGHLALSIIERIVSKRLYDRAFLQEFTDLPLLVRAEDRTLVKLSEIDPADPRFDRSSLEKFAEHPEKVFLAFDRKSGKISAMPGCEGSKVSTLRLEDLSWKIDPALEGRWRIRTKDGEVLVTTAFSVWKKELAAFKAEKMQPLTGVHPSIVDELARDLAKTKVALITMGFAVGKHFNGLLSQRAIASLAALTGKLGPNGGLNTENEWNITGISALSGFDGRYNHRFASGFVSEFMLGDGFADAERHLADEDVRRATGLDKKQYVAKVGELVDKSAGDRGTGKPWWPETETFLLFADARFRRNKGNYREAFLKKAEFLAYGDFRMSEFAGYADILLPCTTPYESWDIRTNPGYHRFANLSIPPASFKKIGEAKSEWEIAALIAEKMQALATADGRTQIADPTHAESGVRDLSKLVEEFTIGGRVKNDRDAVEFTLEHVDQFKPNTVASMVKRGGFLTLNQKAGKSSPLYADRPYNTFESNLFLHQRFETLSGRLTFYVDHPLWIEAGAHVPIATAPIRPRRFPFLLMTPHARWSIHSTYKTAPILLRLQRGRPCVAINPEVAKQRGIADGDEVKIYNDLGEVVLMAKLSPGTPPDAVIVEHGWEPFFFKGKRGYNVLCGDLLNMLEVSDGWGHLKFGTNWDGNQHAYEATVGLEKV